jgi:hypothetical protein
MSPPDPLLGAPPERLPAGGGFVRKAAAVVTGTVLVVLGIAFSVVFIAIAAVGAVVTWGYVAWKARALRRDLEAGRRNAGAREVIEGVAVKLPDDPH